MAVTNTAVFPQTPKTAYALPTGAKTILTNSSSTVLFISGTTNGCEVTHMGVMPLNTVTQTQCLVFVSQDAGSTMNLIGSAVMSAYTLTTSTAVPTLGFTHADGTAITEANPLRLGASDRVYAAIGVASGSGIQFAAEYREF